MPALRQIALNNNAGAFVAVLATIPSTRLSIMEDEAAATQGLQVQGPYDKFATTNVFSFGSEPVNFPDPAFGKDSGREGALIGLPAQGVFGAFNFRAADKLFSARSNGAAGTTLRVMEYE